MSEEALPAGAELNYPQVYAELRQLARQLRGANECITLNTTTLVHEAWLKIAAGSATPASHRQYLGTAAMAMRQILTDYARYRHAGKRDVRKQVAAEEVDAVLCLMGDPDDAHEATATQLLALNGALTRLEALEPELARFVELRFYAGLTLNELAQHRGVTIRTATRTWTRARALLKLWLAEEA